MITLSVSEISALDGFFDEELGILVFGRERFKKLIVRIFSRQDFVKFPNGKGGPSSFKDGVLSKS